MERVFSHSIQASRVISAARQFLDKSILWRSSPSQSPEVGVPVGSLCGDREVLVALIPRHGPRQTEQREGSGCGLHHNGNCLGQTFVENDYRESDCQVLDYEERKGYIDPML
jgi:hypothetical protein